MLRIRNAQILALQADGLLRWIIDSLVRAHPAEAGALGPVALRKLVAAAVDDGRAFGLELHCDLRAFSRVKLLLGSDIADDPGLAWAREYLDDWNPDRGECVVRLEEAVLRRRGERS
jgi:hypothetical protein